MKGDEVPLGGFEPLPTSCQFSIGSTRRKPWSKKLPEGLIPKYKDYQIIRIISGPEAHYFEIAGLRSFLSKEYTVTADLALVAQMRPGDKIRFKETTLDNLLLATLLSQIQCAR